MRRYWSSLTLLAVGCVTTRVEMDGAGGAGNYVVIERDAATDASVTTVGGGMTPLTPDLRGQLEASACISWSSEGEGTPTLLTFVVDSSASMGEKAPGTGGRTKWEVTRDVLQATFNRLPKTARVGLLIFPNQATPHNGDASVDVGSCVNTAALVAAAALDVTGSAQRQALAAALKGAVVAGATPTEDAYGYALDKCLVPALALTGESPSMILITDSEPTLSAGCQGSGSAGVVTSPIIAEVALAWASYGIRTYVIGGPGSEKSPTTGADVRAWLSDAASAGNTPSSSNCSDKGIPNFCHTDLSQVSDYSAGLTQALQTITGQVIPCEYSIPLTTAAGAAVDPGSINVIYTPGGGTSQELLIAQTDAACTGGNGWYFDPSGKIVLCASTCAVIQKDPDATLRILGGCQAITLVN